MDLDALVREKLNGHVKCAGHCQEASELKLIRQASMSLGCYACPSGYVSSIVQYGMEIDVEALKAFLSPLLQGNITNEDIRLATRYSWDLGIDDVPEGAVLREAYWKQNYRRTKSDNSHRVALFLCPKCGSFYTQPLSDPTRNCPKCGQHVD